VRAFLRRILFELGKLYVRGKKMRYTKKKRKITLKDWLVLVQFSDFQIGTADEPPIKVGRVRTPSTLNDMSIGQLLQLSQLQEQDVIFGICRVLLGIPAHKLLRLKATEVILFVAWVMGEVERINKLFSKLQVKRTDDEIKAGFDKIDNGAFGLIDWYAKRMGIHDHEEAQKVSWLIVYQCMKIDHDYFICQRKLMEIQSNAYKHKVH